MGAVNEAEEYVHELCRSSFLSLWTIENPIGPKKGKELSDALAVVGADIVVISVKERNVKPSGDAEVDAGRWYRDAVEGSVKQLRGASRALGRMTEVRRTDNPADSMRWRRAAPAGGRLLRGRARRPRAPGATRRHPRRSLAAPQAVCSLPLPREEREMSLYDTSMPMMIKMLGNLDNWLQEASAYAESRGFEVDVLLQARLAPDMFPLVRQIQSACDAAKFVGARLSETEAPKHPDTETTLAELRVRIAAVIAFLEGIPRSAFEGAETRDLFLPMLRGGSMKGADYLCEFGLPNFYFHVNMIYALLRQQGVKLGKLTYLGGMSVKPAPQPA